MCCCMLCDPLCQRADIACHVQMCVFSLVAVAFPLTAAFAVNATANGLCAPADNKQDCIGLVNVFWATGSTLDWKMDGQTSLCNWTGVTCENGRATRL